MSPNDLFHEVITSFKLNVRNYFLNVDFAIQDLRIGLAGHAYF